MPGDWTRIRHAAIAVLVGAGMAALLPIGASAEVYVCKPAYVVRSASAVVQSNALSLARSAWSSAAAARYGISWQVWTLAQNKSQHCTQSGGVWTCNASAKPCR